MGPRDCELTPLYGKGSNVSEATDVEYWILEREGRLPATDGGWIACEDSAPNFHTPIQLIGESHGFGNGIKWIKWRPIPVDPHAAAACLFGDERPTAEQARTAARHVAGCAECRAKLEAKGGA